DGATLEYLTVVREKSLRCDPRRDGRPPNDQVRQLDAGLRPVQHRVAGRAEVTVNRDAVSRAIGGSERHTALAVVRAGDVVVARDEREVGDAVAYIDGEQRVETAADGIERHRLDRRRGPAIPDGLAARVAGVIGFAGFFGRARIATGLCA